MFVDKPKKTFHVIVVKTVADTWEVEAEDEQDARDNFSRGTKITFDQFEATVDEVILKYNEFECLECGYDMSVVDNVLVCQHCGTSISLKKQRKEMAELDRRRR